MHSSNESSTRSPRFPIHLSQALVWILYKVFIFVFIASSAPAEPEPLRQYFLETRIGKDAAARRVVQSKDTDVFNASLYLQPGDLIYVSASEEQVLRRDLNERLDKSSWLLIRGKKSDHGLDLYLKEDWKAFQFLDGDDLPIYLRFKNPETKKGVSLFKDDKWKSWESCRVNPDDCAGWITPEMSLILLDTRFLAQPTPNGSPEIWELFYKIGYAYRDSKSEIQNGRGWAPARHFERKLLRKAQLSIYDILNAEANGMNARASSNSALHSSTSAGSNSMSENSTAPIKSEAKAIVQEAKAKVIEEMFAGSSESSKPSKYSRWIKEDTATKDTKLEFRIDYEWRADLAQVSFKKSGNVDAELSQKGVLIGLGGIAPILLDFEAGGALTYIFPVRQEPQESRKSPVLQFEQYVVRQSSLLADQGAVRLGVGWHLINQSQKEYGFSSLVGLDAVGFFENRNILAYGRFGPVANSEGTALTNLRLTLGGGIKLNPSKGHRGLNAYFEFSTLNFKNKQKTETANFQSLSLGLRKTF